MDQIKIGKFIAECRKKRGFTQMQLAEKLNITDRAVSKWECGKAMPDSAIMLELCDVLQITVNDLLCGEVVTVDNYNEKLENNLFEMIKQKEASDKRLLRMELLIGILCILPLLISTVLVLTVSMEEWLEGLTLALSLIPMLIATPFALRIEQVAGYYECKHCKHAYVPKYKNVFAAMHIHTTRYMTCPNCKKRSWHKKVFNKK
ncbi:MAG: helix-turn-helix transcriptional regulator [Clostridia bacterium]|nr:helix-turn-helix transcriptional regulator [Clostridia bacterium]